MKRKLVVIALSAVGTTVFWVVLFAVVAWFAPTEPFGIWMTYPIGSDDFGVLFIGNSRTQSVDVFVEDFGNASTNLTAVAPALF